MVVGTTPSVQYVYDDGATGGVASHLRMTDIIYPNGRDISYSYGTAGGADDVLSRMYVIGSGSNTYSEYTYLGAGTIVTESYLEPQVQLDYSANSFAAWDRFGRVLNQVWATYGGTPTTLDGYQYTYDRDSNRTVRTNLTDSALNELYGYDSLNRLTSDTRNGTSYQQWTLDSLGNWTGFTNNSQSQTRTFDSANELTSGTGMATPAFDASGNMTTVPNPSNPATGLTCTYDAWDRMAEVLSGTTIVAQYQYFGDNRRDEKLTNYNSSNVPQNVVYYFLSGQQVVETRAGAPTSAPTSLPPQYQYLWSDRYIDAPIQRDSFNGSGQIQPSQRLFYLGDANYNVTALVNTSGQVVERYVYDPVRDGDALQARLVRHAVADAVQQHGALYGPRIRHRDWALLLSGQVLRSSASAISSRTTRRAMRRGTPTSTATAATGRRSRRTRPAYWNERMGGTGRAAASQSTT